LDVRKTTWSIHTGQYEAIKHELLAHSSVKQLAAVYAVPGKDGWRGQVTFLEGRPKEQGMEVEYLGIDHGFVSTFGLQIVAGRDLSADFTTDKENALLINETAVQAMGWGTPAHAIGKRIDSPSGYPAGVVVGVVKDYHQHSLRESVRPIVMDINPDAFQFYSLRINPQDLPATLAHVRKTWSKFFMGYPFEYFFLDEDFAKQYKKEKQLSQIFVTFSGLAIFIACLGLFGLAAFTTVQRTKEIGIRKVLGASVSSIVALLSKDFLKLVLIAFLMATPIAWWAMNKWLEDFAYRVSISCWIFATTGSLTIFIALLTVSYQAVKAAMANPVKTLRTE
jgi:putative ABC transport system permease protein